ncbi:MAG TPA: LysR family transcriptional regulator [Gammaproteobacteria bacterium]|jgi:DNA-binding transcriptional LysR family regulator
MDIETLKAFTAVADQGSFSLAAERLFLTQPAVSKRISALETELGASLFDRIGRRIVLTEAGRTLLPKARHILDEIDESRRIIANLSQQVVGPLRLATSHHIGLHRLPPVLHDYSRRYPLVDLDIQFMDSEAGCQAVATGNIELAVVTLPNPPLDNLAHTPVWEDNLRTVVATDHPLTTDSGKLTLEKLAAMPAILPEPGTFTRRIIDKPFQELGLSLNINLETNYLETIRMMVSVGLGWSVLPSTMLSNDLTILEIPVLELTRELGIVTHKSRTLSRAAQAFESTLLETRDHSQ